MHSHLFFVSSMRRNDRKTH